MTRGALLRSSELHTPIHPSVQIGTEEQEHMQHEVRNVLTFWGDRGWQASSDGGIDYNSSSILRGYSSLNRVVSELSRRVTIHSVSYSHLIFPGHQVTAIRVFATVVYTGPSALGLYGTKNPYGRGAIDADTTVLEVAAM
jgi:hypothetical protein